MPCYAYGTDSNKPKEKSKEKSSGSKSKKKSKRSIDKGKAKQEVKANPLQALIAQKLYNEMMQANSNNILPANNSSGASTQGSSTRDFISSAKKKKQQECYYRSSTPGNNMFYYQNDTESQPTARPLNFQFEGVSPNIFIVEEDKKCNEEEMQVFRDKIRNRKGKLQEVGLEEFSEDTKVSLFYF